MIQGGFFALGFERTASPIMQVMMLNIWKLNRLCIALSASDNCSHLPEETHEQKS